MSSMTSYQRGKSRRTHAFLGLWLLACAIPVFGGEPSAARGRVYFLQCAACHSTEAQQQGKLGPPLKGVVGRHAGAVAGYSYSKALLASNLVWTPTELDRWLTRPEALVPGTAMLFAGIPSQAQRADLIAYLKTLGSGSSNSPDSSSK